MLPIVVECLNNMRTKIFTSRSAVLYFTKCMTHSPPGSGAEKGGGAGGSIKEAGGGLGQYAASREEGYFYNKSREEIEKLKQKMKEQTSQNQKKDD